MTSEPVTRHAEVSNGQIRIRYVGRMEPVSPLTAFAEWLILHDSPFPSSRERAADIRRALDQMQ